jgi:hypothetical protein
MGLDHATSGQSPSLAPAGSAVMLDSGPSGFSATMGCIRQSSIVNRQSSICNLQSAMSSILVYTGTS